MTRADKYEKSLQEKWSMRFNTKPSDGDSYDGVVTHIKSGFIALREEASFEFNGVNILPKRWIKSIRDGKYERCANDIIRQNGQIKRLRPTRWLDSCETLADVLETMRRRDIWPVVEVIGGEGYEESLYIGPITSVGSKQFSIWCYDAAGKWEKEYELDYKEVFRIEFDDSYSKHFNSYMELIERPA